MILVSLLLVVVSAVSLIAGMAFSDQLAPLVVSIIAAILAGMVLYVALRRTRKDASGTADPSWAAPVPPPPQYP